MPINPAIGPIKPILMRSLNLIAERLIAAKIKRKVELANEEIIVKLVVLTKMRLTPHIINRLIHGISFVLSL